MHFNSTVFLCLVTITFIFYYLPFLSKYQIPVLILSSLVFYSYHQPVLVLILLLSVSINVLSSYFVVYGNRKFAKFYAILGVGINLSILSFFKYSPLVARTFFNESSSIGAFLITIPLPIGISFFTFQGISLIIDVFTGKYFKSNDVVPVNFLDHVKRVFFFKSFFPQLISGPIVKAHEFMPQIGIKSFNDIPWNSCFKDLITGYFLKMVVADNLKDFTFWIAFPYFQKYSTVTLLTMLFGYSFQIFADFAGYSLIAIGLAKLFGYNFKSNFNFPYISTSFKEFWQRWHISLSSFLKEYLYIPLGGNKKGAVRTYVNLMLTMILGGLWHGAAWSYAIWGGFHGCALAIERFLYSKVNIHHNRFLSIVNSIFVFSLISFAWMFFKLPHFSHAVEYLKSLFLNLKATNSKPIIIHIFLYSLPVVLYHMLYLIKKSGFQKNIQNVEWLAYGLMLFLIIVNSGSPGAFIYFQF